MKTRSRSLGAIFVLPILLAMLSLIGLIGALLEDGPWDGIGAGLLAVCLVAVGWARFARR